jgi:hypothetical protein
MIFELIYPYVRYLWKYQPFHLRLLRKDKFYNYFVVLFSLTAKILYTISMYPGRSVSVLSNTGRLKVQL